MSDTIVEVANLKKRYGELEAVKGVDFSIERGEIFGFLGPNGAGKTTTIAMLSCLFRPTSGTASICGFDLMTQTKEVKQRIGLVPQDLALYPTLSARDNLLYFGRIYGLKGAELRQRADEALTMVGLLERARDAIDTFSGGMKRRINIAAGLLHRPELLFLDEPTVGVDPQSRNFIFENVERLNREGVSVLYTTHYMEEAERLCHRVAVIDEGRIVAMGTPRELIQRLGGGVILMGVPPNLPAALLDTLRALPGTMELSLADHQIKIKARQAQQTLIGAIEVLNQADVSIQSLAILEPNLESVFLELTGKHLRE